MRNSNGIGPMGEYAKSGTSQIAVVRLNMRRFQLYGLTIASEFDLLLPEGSDAAPPAVTIRRAHPEFFNDLVSAAPGGNHKSYRYKALPDGSSYLTWNELFDFLIASDGRAIVCGPRGGTVFEGFKNELLSEPYISYLISFAMSFALLRIGDETLHATVIESGGQAIGFLGNSGAGKSTLASYFLRRGCRLLTDDLLRVTFRGQTVMAHPGPQRIKLFPESAAEFMQRETCTVAANPFTAKLLIVPAADQRMAKGAPLRALYLLESLEERDEINSIGVERIRSGDAALNVIASTFNAAVKTPERLGRQLQFVRQILSKIPIFRLSYPRRFDALASVYDLVVHGYPR